MKDRTGEERIMNNGMKAIILHYYDSTCIDVQFEDGTIVEDRTYGSFMQGRIRNPNVPNINKKKNHYVGRSTVLRNGCKVTIIDYKGQTSVTVRFEDGYEKTVNLVQFYARTIAHPNHLMRQSSCLGETRTMSNGMKATCINYINANNIDVRFEDGTIIKKAYKSSFVKGTIKYPTNQKYEGLCLTMHCGKKATIIKYVNHKDVTIRFEDGYEKKTTLYAFQKGSVAHKKEEKKQLVGSRRLMECGMFATCIMAYTFSDIQIEFEDGTLVDCKRSNFYVGKVANPSLKKGAYIQQKLFVD